MMTAMSWPRKMLFRRTLNMIMITIRMIMVTIRMIMMITIRMMIMVIMIISIIVSFPRGFQSLDNPEMFIPIFASVKDRNTWFFCISERFFHKICTSRYKKMSIKSWRSKILTCNKCSPNRVGARGIKVPWEGVFQSSLNLHEGILEIFPGVNKRLDTNLLVKDARVANSAKPFRFGHLTP